MTDLRKAAEMALETAEKTINDNWEAYKKYGFVDEIEGYVKKRMRFISETLRQALAQTQEWKHCRHCGFQYRPPKEDKWHPLAQPEQEPVAYLDEGLGAFYWANDYEKDVGFTPLYTAPPKREWVGLTRLELDIATLGLEDLGDCYAAIEAKLKEKNT